MCWVTLNSQLLRWIVSFTMCNKRLTYIHSCNFSFCQLRAVPCAAGLPVILGLLPTRVTVVFWQLLGDDLPTQGHCGVVKVHPSAQVYCQTQSVHLRRGMLLSHRIWVKLGKKFLFMNRYLTPGKIRKSVQISFSPSVPLKYLILLTVPRIQTFISSVPRGDYSFLFHFFFFFFLLEAIIPQHITYGPGSIPASRHCIPLPSDNISTPIDSITVFDTN